ncbi:MAG: hypothetical protein GAK28_00581 [Luteibacter sp.]|uniref:crAss001_48 related protein n=1 Tax=Luteibacter sp. TaxID=1886636 RepID=UPI001381061A|nr:hypothetical protein [Luteibacter sp.]KAF1008949.1 MAG: hypothetical protein GAK28_00581 [Luteibacter sp.]
MTQNYIGTKIVLAWSQEKDGQSGYGVKYADGYTSWSPTAAFEAAYLPIGNVSHLPDYQQRVIGERAELNDKIAKLDSFTNTSRFAEIDSGDQSLLREQLTHMRAYAAVLNARIEGFDLPL